ncbi:hypothetical protein Tco_0693348 [Tanacetum coccineum]
MFHNSRKWYTAGQMLVLFIITAGTDAGLFLLQQNRCLSVLLTSSQMMLWGEAKGSWSWRLRDCDSEQQVAKPVVSESEESVTVSIRSGFVGRSMMKVPVIGEEQHAFPTALTNFIERFLCNISAVCQRMLWAQRVQTPHTDPNVSPILNHIVYL